jgi:hypothetical protein
MPLKMRSSILIDAPRTSIGRHGLLGLFGRGICERLDGSYPRYQRQQAWIVPSAFLVVVVALSESRVHNPSFLFVPATLEQNVSGPTVAVQVPPVILSVGAILGVDLVPLADVEHAEPACMPVPNLSGVGNPALIFEHAVA